jgi:hypothetical protein
MGRHVDWLVLALKLTAEIVEVLPVRESVSSG